MSALKSRPSSSLTRLSVTFAISAALVAGIAGCGSGDSDSGEGKVTVFAAASLTEAFTELGEQFEAQNDGTTIEFSFAASSDLAGQIEQGAPADVFASADEPNMNKVVDAGLNDGEPQAFAGNVLEVALPESNPGQVTGLESFAEPGLKLAVCDLEVPCGKAATGVFEKAGVDPRIDSYEPDVKSVMTKVELDEIDAGLVYRSDVLAAGDRIDSIPVPVRFEVVNTYPIVVVRESSNPDGAREFINLVMSADGATELEKRGFREP